VVEGARARGERRAWGIRMIMLFSNKRESQEGGELDACGMDTILPTILDGTKS
jgi:hypothetical protein